MLREKSKRKDFRKWQKDNNSYLKTLCGETLIVSTMWSSASAVPQGTVLLPNGAQAGFQPVKGTYQPRETLAGNHCLIGIAFSFARNLIFQHIFLTESALRKIYLDPIVEGYNHFPSFPEAEIQHSVNISSFLLRHILSHDLSFPDKFGMKDILTYVLF